MAGDDVPWVRCPFCSEWVVASYIATSLGEVHRFDLAMAVGRVPEPPVRDVEHLAGRDGQGRPHFHRWQTAHVRRLAPGVRPVEVISENWLG